MSNNNQFNNQNNRRFSNPKQSKYDNNTHSGNNNTRNGFKRNNHNYRNHQIKEKIENTETNMFLIVKPRTNLYDWQSVFINYAIKTYGHAGQTL